MVYLCSRSYFNLIKPVEKRRNIMRRLTLFSSAILLFTSVICFTFSEDRAVFIQSAFCQSNDTMKGMNMGEGEMDFVHPFFTHMGLPDAVGHGDLRLSGVATREEEHTREDFGFHLETGLADRLGLHIRNDRISNNTHTEIMLQYAAIKSRDGMSGFSPFIEAEIPTHKDERHTYGLFGFSTMWSTHILEFNQSLEYSPREEALEGSLAMVGKVGQRFFPVVEFILAAANGEKPQNSMIGGLKYRINKNIVLGIGYRVPVTKVKEFTNQVLIQTDLEW